jgi:methylenetetrahydrofolate reductase (NADPH)
LSFELYPPRTPDAQAVLGDTLDQLAAAGPDLVSVTYGANGSSRKSSLEVSREILARGVDPMAHLRCAGSTLADETRVIRESLDTSITRFLALRGDPPADLGVGDEFLGELRTAGELVQLIHHVQRERVPYAQVDDPGSPGAKRIWSADDVTIAVAAFPNGHPRARSVRQDLDSLLAKDAAGANLAITQLCFVPTTTSSFVDRARSIGVSMRIIPGIMPVVSPHQLRRVVELTGNALPMDILREFESAPDEATQCARGISRATALPRTFSLVAPTAFIFTRSTSTAPCLRFSAKPASSTRSRRTHDLHRNVPSRHHPRVPPDWPPSRTEKSR